MDNPGDDDAGETSAVRSKTQPMKPSDQEIATDEACSHYPYRDWCRACFRITGGMKNKYFSSTLELDVLYPWLVVLLCRLAPCLQQKEEQNSFLVASMDYGFFTDGDDGEHHGSRSVSGGQSQVEYDDQEHACPMQRWMTRQQSWKRSSR